MKLPRLPLVHALLLFLLVPLVCAQTKVPLAAAVGQAEVPTKALPIVCLSVALDGVDVPIDHVVVQDITSKKRFKIDMARAHGRDGKPRFPKRVTGGRYAVSMAILAVPAGTYRLSQVQYQSSEDAGESSELIFDLPKAEAYQFVVKPGMVNYAGTVIIASNWGTAEKRALVNDTNNSLSSEGEFGGSLRTQDTTAADRSWLKELIPGLAALPSCDSPIGAKQEGAEGK